MLVWRSWTRASWYNHENNQQDALYRLIYYSKSALHVSGDVFAHHQEFMMGEKNRPKHLQSTWNNKLTYIVHLVGYFHSYAFALQFSLVKHTLSYRCYIIARFMSSHWTWRTVFTCSVAWLGDLNTDINFNYHFLIALHNFRVKKGNILTTKEENRLYIAKRNWGEGDASNYFGTRIRRKFWRVVSCFN